MNYRNNLREGITVHFAQQYEDVYKVAFPKLDKPRKSR